jgi:hypothetical protein
VWRQSPATAWLEGPAQQTPPHVGTKETPMVALLWILAVVLVIAGIVTLIRGQILLGVILIVVGLFVGPGGVSLFT